MFRLVLFLCSIFIVNNTTSSAATKPNVLVFYLDDMGWAEPGCYGGKLAPTPHMDSIAANGIRFTNGYVSACVCSPSRVGLLTGRYQARSGHDANSEGKASAGRELVLTETTIAQRLQTAGYKTCITGKWHVGITSPEFLPASRGFDVSFGTTGNLGEGPNKFYRGLQMIPDPEGSPVTSPIYAQEAIKFIDAHHQQPWFLYMPMNAVHGPIVASAEYLSKYSNLEKRQQAYAAMIHEADDAVGRVLQKLRDLKLEENTLIFLISDNGGASELSNKGGLRGRKWLVYEGGIRVTWLMQWKNHLKPGQVIDTPVIQLDVLPTALAAAGVDIKPAWELDGQNLLPWLEGKTTSLNRDALFWRFGVQYAVRQGDWKLVKAGLDEPAMLINLKDDMGEQHDLSTTNPEKTKSLQQLWDNWNSKMQPPRWEDKRWNDGNSSKKERKQTK